MTGGPWSHCPIPARFPDVETEAYREVTCPRVNRGGAREGQGSGHCGGGGGREGVTIWLWREVWAFPVRTGKAGQG